MKQITLKSLEVSTFQGLRMPLKNAGIHIGNTTASFRSFFASSKSAMLSLKKKKEKQGQTEITPGSSQEGWHLIYNHCIHTTYNLKNAYVNLCINWNL